MSASKSNTKQLTGDDVDVDEIERLLQQLDGGNNNQESKTSGGSKATKQQHQQGKTSFYSPQVRLPSTERSSPSPGGNTQRGGLVGFSTYQASPAYTQASMQDDEGSAAEGPRILGKLAPLRRSSSSSSPKPPSTITADNGGGSVVLPEVGKKVVWSRFTETVGGGAPAALVSRPNLEEFRQCEEGDDTQQQQQQDGTGSRTVSNATIDVNFLPVMHARFVRDVAGITPMARWGCTFTAVGSANEDSLLLFGGTVAPSGEATNDLFAYSPRNSCWEPAVSVDRDSIPLPRYDHAAVGVDQRFLVVHGGKTSHGVVSLGDLWSYDTIRQRWEQLFNPVPAAVATTNAKNEPVSLHGHSMVYYKQRLYLFGGRCRKHAGGDDDNGSGTKEVLTSDIFVFHLPSKQWKKRVHVAGKLPTTTTNDAAAAGGAVGTPSAVTAAAPQQATRLCPAKRYHHAACVHRERLMIIHGGETADGTVLNDTWAFDFVTRQWTCLHSGDTYDAVPRSRHALFGSGEAILALGGCAKSSTSVLAQRLESFLSVLPVTLAPAPASSSPNPMMMMPLCTGQWSPVILGNSACVPSSKRSFGAAVLNGFVYAFGGSSGAETATNHLLRCLAMDGIPRNDVADSLSVRMKLLTMSVAAGGGGGGGNADPSSVNAAAGAGAAAAYLFPPRWDCDVALAVMSSRFYVHRAILASRAPKLWRELLDCRIEQPMTPLANDASTEITTTTSLAAMVPIVFLEGNSRVKGLSVTAAVITPATVGAVLNFIYTGTLERSGGASAALPQLAEGLLKFAVAYDLLDLQLLLNAPMEQDGTSPQKPSSSSSVMTPTVTDDDGELRALEHLSRDMQSLLEDADRSGNVTLVFVDPHTGEETNRTAHTWVLANACTYFSRLLRPLWTETGCNQTTVDGVTARRTAGKRPGYAPLSAQSTSSSSRRGIIVGPVRIPVMSVKPILRFLYTHSMDVAPEAALPTLMGAHALGLAALSSHCEALVAREEVSYSTCCDFLTLARNHSAPLLEELCLVTAAAGFESGVKLSQGFMLLPLDQRALIERMAAEIRGSWAVPSPPRTEQKPAAVYAAKYQQSVSRTSLQQPSFA